MVEEEAVGKCFGTETVGEVGRFCKTVGRGTEEKAEQGYIGGWRAWRGK